MGGQNWNFQTNFMAIKDICGEWNEVLNDGNSATAPRRV
jgi:hypothetical protein